MASVVMYNETELRQALSDAGLKPAAIDSIALLGIPRSDLDLGTFTISPSGSTPVPINVGGSNIYILKSGSDDNPRFDLQIVGVLGTRQIMGKVPPRND